MKRTLMKRGLFAAAVVGGLCLLPVGRAAACVVPSATRPGQEVMIPSDLNEAVDDQAAESSRSHSGSIVGLWKTVYYYQGQVSDVAFETWERGGTEILNDYTNPIEDNVCLGVWVRTGPRTFKLKHPSWTFDTSGNLTGTAIIRATVTVDGDADRFSGSYTVDLYETSGHFLGQVAGPLKGTRIRPD